VETKYAAKGQTVFYYYIRVKGHLDDRWSEWFDGLTISNRPNGHAVLYGPIVDESALHGVLAKVRDLGLPLIVVRRVSPARLGHGTRQAKLS
jgi:hypothetical protein